MKGKITVKVMRKNGYRKIMKDKTIVKINEREKWITENRGDENEIEDER